MSNSNVKIELALQIYLCLFLLAAVEAMVCEQQSGSIVLFGVIFTHLIELIPFSF